MAYAELPYAEQLVVYILKQGGQRVSSQIPKSPTFPLTTVIRVGGTAVVRQLLDAANVDLNGFGNSQTEAFTQVEEARRLLMEAEGTTYLETGGAPLDAFLSGVEDIVGPQYLPDPDTHRDRYVLSVRVYTCAP